MRKNVIAIVSSKGGAGKTVTTANICLVLSEVFNKRVLVIDTNISTASLGLHFDVLEPRATLYDVFCGSCDVREAVHKINKNLFLIPASMKFDRKEKNFNIVSEEVRKMSERYEVLLSNFVSDFDFIILDTAPGFNTESVSAMKSADGVVMVSNPEYPALVATANLIKYVKLLGISNGGLVLNKITGSNFEISEEEVEDVLKIKIIGKIPSDRKVMESVAKRNPVVREFPHCKSAVAYKKFGGFLVKRKYTLSLYEKFLEVFGT